MQALERVQKKCTKMVSVLEGMSHKERLDKLGLFSLKQLGLT